MVPEATRPAAGLELPGPKAVLGKAAAENFPVAPLLLPPRLRRDLLALYGFARLVDDVGDEAPGDRLVLLDLLEADLERVWTSTPRHPLLARLQPTVRAAGIPPEPFRRLVAANRQDQTTTRYATYAALAAYCELSANPVGHLVLYVLGLATPERFALSDAICTGLQLTEHLQDVAEDRRRGRVYLPQEDLAWFGCHDDDLLADRSDAPLRRLIAFEVGRARVLLDRGAPLVRLVGWPAKLAVAGFVAGGRAALDAIGRSGYEVLAAAPRAGRARLAPILARTLIQGR